MILGRRREGNWRKGAETGVRIGQLLQEARDMLVEMDAAFGITMAMRRNDETTTKKNDTMAAARRGDDETTTKDTRCDEERAETKSGRGREFPFAMGKEIPRNKMMIGVERNTATELQGLMTSEATANVTSACPSDCRNVRHRTGRTHSCRGKTS